MGSIEAPKSKESALSFEDFKSKVTEALKLIRTRELLNPSSRSGPIRERQDYREGPVYYRADLEKVKDLPEFDNLRVEEQEILASGASKQEIAKYSNVAERAYKRKEEVLKSIEQKLNELRRGNDGVYGEGHYVYEAADILFMASREGGGLVNGDLEDALLRDRFSSMQSGMEVKAEWDKKEKEWAALQEKFGEKYRGVQSNAEAALKAQRMFAELNAIGATAQGRGFSSSQQMWEHDLEAVRDLREEVGKDNFKILENMNRSR